MICSSTVWHHVAVIGEYIKKQNKYERVVFCSSDLINADKTTLAHANKKDLHQ